MDNFIFKRVIEDKVVDLLERLSYEIEGSKRIIKELITENPDNVAIFNSETYKFYEKKYEEHIAEYEIAKKELQNNYIPKKATESGTVLKWNLEFDSAILYVTVTGKEYENMTSEEFFND